MATDDDLPKSLSETYRHIDELSTLASKDPAQVQKILPSALEKLKACLEEQSFADEERKRALDELRISEELFHAFFNISAIGTAQLGLDERFIDANDRLCQITGYSRQELLRMTPTDLTHPDDRQREKDILSVYLQGLMGDYQAEKRYIRKDGLVVWVQVTASLIRDCQGKPLCSMAVIQDITDRKRTEEKLVALEEKTRDLLKRAPTGIYEIDFHGPRFLMVNDFVCAATGYTREELLAMSPFDLLADESKVLFQDRIRRQLSGEKVDDTVEYRGKVIDGRELIWVLKVAFTYDGEGRPVGAIVVGEDITERKMAEEALKLTSYTLEKAREIVIWFRPDGRIFYANDAACESFGYSRNELLSLSIFDINPNYTRAQWNDRWETLKGKGSTKYVVENLAKDGHWFPIDVTNTYIKHGGSEFMVGYARDITERRRADEALNEVRLNLERSLRFTEALLSAIPAPAFFKDREGRYIGCNHAFSELMGITADQIKGKTVEELWPAEYAALYHQKDLELMEHPGVQVYDFKVQDKDGVIRPVIYVKNVFYDGYNEVAGIVGTFVDITERKQAEEALHESEARFRGIYELSPIGIEIYDPDGKLIHVNKACLEIFGIDGVGDVLGFSLFDDPNVPDGIKDKLLNGDTVRYESIFDFEKVRALGLYDTIRSGTAHIDVIITPLRLGGLRDPRGYLAQVQDITERKRAEEALRESEEKFRIIADTSQASITLYQDGHTIYANHASEIIFGYSLDERRHMKFWEMIHPDYQEIAKARMAALLEGGSYHPQNEYKIIRKDGEERWILSSSSWLTYRGKPAIIANSIDITGRKKAELELSDAIIRDEKNQLVLDAVIQQMPAGIIITDASGTSAKNNQAMDRIWKRNMLPTENIENHDYRAFYADGREYKLEEWPLTRSLVKGEVVLGEEMTILRGDGTKGIVHVSSSPVRDKDGKIIAGVVVDVDITKQKRMEEELSRAKDELELRVQERTAELLEAKDAAEAAARTKSAFMANMSHELRTPLNAILGMTGILLDEDISPEHKDLLETVRTSGDALLSLINDVLYFSKMEAEKTDLEEQPFEIRALVEEALDLVAPAAARKDLNLAYNMVRGIPETAMGDPGKIRQILSNLLSNAVKFTEKGEITVTVKYDSAGVRDDLRFSVTDTGIGIPQDFLAKIFQPFSQADVSTTRRFGGTGLGLSISKSLAELMGGRIWVESKPGIGSTLHFTVKVKAEPGAVESWNAWPKPGLAGKRLLIADESRTNRRILGELAVEWGMAPQVAASGRSVLEMINKGDTFDTAIIGSKMPDMDVSNLAKVILRGTGDIPMIFLSQLGQRQPSEFRACMAKPIKPVQLYNILTGFFDRQAGEIHPGFEEEEPDHKDLAILLAEDEPSNQKVTLQMLRKLGYRADIVANGREALEAMERQPYNVVLMDVRMPEMDGLEATREIRRLWPSGPKIIAITAYALHGDREKCLEAGMDDYIAKPVKRAELAKILEKYQNR